MTLIGFVLLVFVSGFSGYHYRDSGCVKFECPQEKRIENNVKSATDIQPTTKVKKSVDAE